MKGKIKKIFCVVMLTCLFSGFAAVPVSSADYEQIECVILLDVSGSMGWIGNSYGSDPEKDGTRVSIEAVKAFINNCPSYIDMKISLVVYNHECAQVTSAPVNIRTNGTDTIKRDLEKILKSQIDGIKCWSGMTDIANPLDLARAILDKNTAESVKKGVLLFTDGKIEIYDKDSKHDEPRETEAIEMCRNIVGDFKKDDINFYAVGLNGGDSSGKDSIDREFLDDLGIRAGRPPYIADTAGGDSLNKLIDYFLDVYVDLVGAKKRVSEDIPVIGGRQEQAFNIYGDITREVNISVTSGEPLDSMQVYYGNDDMTGSGDVSIIMEKMSATVKIMNPGDGDWKVVFQGQAGDTAKMTQIHLYDLSMKCVRDNDTFDVYLFNEYKQKRVTLARIYKESIFKAFVIDKNDRSSDIIWEINANEDGYEASISEFKKQADESIYSLKFELEKEGYFSYNYTFPDEIEIKPPEIKSIILTDGGGFSSYESGNEIIFRAELIDENQNQISSKYPGLNVLLNADGKEYEMKLQYVSSETACYEYTLQFNTEGSYSVFASINSGELRSNILDIEIIPPPDIAWLIAALIVAAGVIIIIIILLKKTIHTIVFNDTDKNTVVYRNPLLITTDENSGTKNKYVIIVGDNSVFKGINLAKIETCGIFPLPALHRKIKVVKESNIDIELEQIPPDKKISAPNDVEIIFKYVLTGDILKLRFHYDIKSEKPRKKSKENDFDDF